MIPKSNSFFVLTFLFLIFCQPQPGSSNSNHHDHDVKNSEESDSSKSVEFEMESTTMSPTDAVIVEEADMYEILKSERLRECGLVDVCPDVEQYKLNKGVGYVPGQDKLTENYQLNPFSCRCDVEKCTEYGDCCVALRTPITERIRNNSILISKKANPWHCHPLQKQKPQTSALMVSECPPELPETTSSSSTTHAQLCTGSPAEIPPDTYTYLVDLPAYSNRSRILYKNIFCALCHGESFGNMIKWTLKLFCNTDLAPADRPHFFENASYIPIQRQWLSGNKTCKLLIPELENDKIEIHIPNVRYCGYNKMSDHCPPDFVSQDGVNYDLLCSSYTQFIFDKGTRQQFKNPHCAVCHGATDPEKNFRCVRIELEIGVRVTPGESGATLDGVGLNFLFDFGKGRDGNNYVGYETLCEENEIWDYVRHKCHPIICGKDHVLKDGHCLARISAPSPVEGAGNFWNNETDGAAGGGSSGENDEDDNAGSPTFTSDCYRIILFAHEFELLANSSIAVNRSNNEIIILEPGDYEIVNETMVSICAKYLHEAFPSRFSPILNYLTVVSLGLSVTFSFLHMCFFIILPKLRNLPAQNLFCLTLCLFVSQLCFLTLIRHTGENEVCIGAAITMHFFFLAAFSWMNVLSFDIWRTFSSLVRRSVGSNSKRKSFLKYSAFAWMTPLVIVTFAALTDLLVDPEEGEAASFMSKIKPGYGENGLCWISKRLALFVFFAVPATIVVLFNLILFSRTAVAILVQHQESSKVLRGEHNSAQTSDKARLKLYIKLALIMGLTWILGIVSAFLNWDWLWYPFVVLNGLQGTFIFFSFDFKWKIFRMFRELVVPLAGRRRGTSTSSTSNNTTNVVVTMSSVSSSSVAAAAKRRHRISMASTSASGGVNL